MWIVKKYGLILLIAYPKRYREEKVFLIGSQILWGLIFAFFLLFIVGIAILRNHPSSFSPFSSFVANQRIPLDKLGEGALSLQKGPETKFLPDLRREIRLLAKNGRPVIAKQGADVWLSLASSQEDKKLRKGEKVFLSVNYASEHAFPSYHFSAEPTALWISPSNWDVGGVVLDVGMKTACANQESVEEQGVILVSEQDLSRPLGIENTYIAALQQAHFWGVDIVAAKFSAQKRGLFPDKVRLALPSIEEQQTLCFVSLGDYLVWDGREWSPAQEEALGHGMPLAQVKHISARSIEFSVWDAEGFVSHTIRIDMPSRGGMVVHNEDLPHSIRMRTAKQISCCFGKKRCLVKEGDWVLKTSHGWRVLRRSLDLESYLCHKLCGDLFIVESLVQESGKLLLKGLFVDEMRTASQPVILPVLADGKNKGKRMSRDMPKEASKASPVFRKIHLPLEGKRKSL